MVSNSIDQNFYLVYKQVSETISVSGWSNAWPDAGSESEDAGVEFAADYPASAALIAMGVLALTTAWGLEVSKLG